MATGDSHGQVEDDDVLTQPLLADTVEESLVKPPATLNDHVETKQSPSSIRGVFFKISFLLLGDYLSAADDTFLMTVYPRIAYELSSSDRSTWLLLSESLVWSISLPIYGFLADKYGSKLPILGAYILLVIGCVVTWVGPTFEVVIIGRIISGVAGAGMFSMTAIVIAENAKPSDVGVLRSYANVFSILGRNTGPVIGGLLSDAIGWRRAFLCEIPIAILCFVVVAWFFDSTPGTTRAGDEAEPVIKSSGDSGGHAIDFLGVILFGVTVTAFALVLTHLDNDVDRKSVVMIVSVVIFCTCGVALFFRERSLGERSFIPLANFSRGLCILFLIQFLWVISSFSLVANLARYFARVENIATSATALHLIPSSAGSLIGNLFSGRLVKIFKRYKLIMQLSIGLGSIGFFLLAFLWQGHIDAGRSFIVALTGLATGMLNASMFVALNAASEEHKKGSILGFFFFAQELGCLTGLSGASSILEGIFELGVVRDAPDVPNRSAIIKQILRDSSFVFTLSKMWQKIAISSFLKGWKIYCLISAAITLVAQPLLLAVKEKPMD